METEIIVVLAPSLAGTHSPFGADMLRDYREGTFGYTARNERKND